jgi:hypothetical protein
MLEIIADNTYFGSNIHGLLRASDRRSGFYSAQKSIRIKLIGNLSGIEKKYENFDNQAAKEGTASARSCLLHPTWKTHCFDQFSLGHDYALNNRLFISPKKPRRDQLE